MACQDLLLRFVHACSAACAFFVGANLQEAEKQRGWPMGSESLRVKDRRRRRRCAANTPNKSTAFECVRGCTAGRGWSRRDTEKKEKRNHQKLHAFFSGGGAARRAWRQKREARERERERARGSEKASRAECVRAARAVRPLTPSVRPSKTNQKGQCSHVR